MDDEIVAWFAVGLLLGLGGWILGIVGFFSSRRALHEIAELRRQAAPPSIARSAVPQPPPASVPRFVPPPVPEPVAAAAQPTPAVPPPADETPGPVRRPDIEALLTTRWGVWLGSAALLMAGVFLVRYAVDQGMLGPGPRCVLAGTPRRRVDRRGGVAQAARGRLADAHGPGAHRAWPPAGSRSCSAPHTAPACSMILFLRWSALH